MSVRADKISFFIVEGYWTGGWKQSWTDRAIPIFKIREILICDFYPILLIKELRGD